MQVKKINPVSVVMKSNSLVLKKQFVKKISLDDTYLQTNTFLSNKKLVLPSNSLDIKTNLYDVLKILKVGKREILKNSSEKRALENYCFNLQTSNLFSSQFELIKKQKSTDLNVLILRSELKKFESSKSFILEKRKASNKFLFSKSFKIYNKHFKYLKNDKQNLLLNILKQKRFLKKIFEGRNFLYLIRKKKKYRLLNKFYEKNKIRIRYFLNIYKLSHLRYLKVKKYSSQLFKKLLWRRKKRRKWKKPNIFRFYRSRRRLFYKFYIPKHIEINYKTFNFVRCNSVDLSTLNSKIPFWLNLRRLTTFLSS